MIRLAVVIVGHDDKIAFVGGNELAKTTLFKILMGELEPDEGHYKWGVPDGNQYKDISC